MRNADKEKSPLGKASKTINFDKIVLLELEKKARLENTTVSNIINSLCRERIMTDERFYEEMRKHHALKVNEYDYMIDRIKAKREMA